MFCFSFVSLPLLFFVPLCSGFFCFDGRTARRDQPLSNLAFPRPFCCRSTSALNELLMSSTTHANPGNRRFWPILAASHSDTDFR